MAISQDKEKIATIVKKEVANKIRTLAEKENRTMSAMAALLLEKALQDFEK